MRTALVGMLCVFSGAAFAADSAPASDTPGSSVKWTGSAAWRFNSIKYDDNLGSTKQDPGQADDGKGVSVNRTKNQQVRANLGLLGTWKSVDWAAGVRTFNKSNSDWQTMQGNTHDHVLDLDQIWARYNGDLGEAKWSVTGGMQKNTFVYDRVSQIFFSNEVRWDGFTEELHYGGFGLNLGQYYTGAMSKGTDGATTYSSSDATTAMPSTQSHFTTALFFQTYFNHDFTDDIKAALAVGYYVYYDDSNTNRTGGNFDNSTGSNGAAATTNTAPAVNSLLYKIGNMRQIQIYNSWKLPYNLQVTGELVLNKQGQYDVTNVGSTTSAGVFVPQYSVTSPYVNVSSTLWTAGVRYGTDLKKANDWYLAYNYGSKGIGSTPGIYTYINWQPDNKGHFIQGQYAVADVLNIGFKAIYLQEIEKKAPTTGLAYSGTNAGQQLNTTYLEVNGGVMF